MRRTRLLSVRQHLSRGLGAALPLACALLLLAGTFEWHGDAAAHLPVPVSTAAAGDGPVFACVDGHGNRSHVERAHAVEREHCAACLHRTQRVGDATAAPAAIAHGDSADRPWAPRRAPLLSPVLDRAPSRGPPAV